MAFSYGGLVCFLYGALVWCLSVGVYFVCVCVFFVCFMCFIVLLYCVLVWCFSIVLRVKGFSLVL